MDSRAVRAVKHLKQPPATPAARALAARLGIDLRAVAVARRPTGQITVGDVRAFASERTPNL